MPTDTDTKPDVDDHPGDPPEHRRRTDPPAATGPTEDDIRSFVREELVKMLGGGGKPKDAPDLSTDKKLEAYVREITTQAVADLKAAEGQTGKPPVDDKPDETHQPESEPQQVVPWTDRARKF